MALILPSPLYPLFLALLISFFLSLSFSNCHSGGRVGMPPLPHIELPASSVVEISGNVASLMRSAAWLSLRQHYGLDSIPVLSIEIKRFSFKHAKDFKGEKNVVLVIDLWVSLLSFAFFFVLDCGDAKLPRLHPMRKRRSRSISAATKIPTSTVQVEAGREQREFNSRWRRIRRQ